MADNDLRYVGARPQRQQMSRECWSMQRFFHAVPRGFNPVCGAEIEELHWFDPVPIKDLPVAPLTREHVLPGSWPHDENHHLTPASAGGRSMRRFVQRRWRNSSVRRPPG